MSYVAQYYVCGVTLSCTSTPGKLKSLPDHGGNRTCNLWDTSPMLHQLSCEVKSVQVGDISELRLVPSILMFLRYDTSFFVCVGVVYSGEYVCGVTLSVHYLVYP